MKYRELIQFEPINEVVKFSRLEEEDYRKGLVRNFVFSRDYEQTIIPRICENLDYTQTYRPFQKDLFSSFDTFGLQIVGNYGTGKSHLMSLVSLVAENEEYLGLISNANAKDALSAIAGKYKIIRFELGNDQELWDIICYQIDKKLKEYGVNYSISADDSLDQYSVKLAKMMAHFEEKYPDKAVWVWTGFLWEDVASDLLESSIDVVVDGQFKEDLKDLRLKYRGSSNQRVINVKDSTRDNIIIYE
jgi:hypothetical protein